MLDQSAENFPSSKNTGGVDSEPAMTRQSIVVVLVVLVIGGIYLIWQQPGSTAMVPLINAAAGDDQPSVAELEAKLKHAGLDDYLIEDGRLLVPESKRQHYHDLCHTEQAIPQSNGRNVQEQLDKQSYFESEKQKRLRYQIAKANDLGQTLTAFDDLAWATVDYDEKEVRGFNPTTIHSASVVLCSKSKKPLSPARIQSIREMIAASYAGMTADQVTVTDTGAQQTYSGTDTPEIQRQRQREYELKQELTELLKGYPELKIAVTSRYASLATETPPNDAADPATLSTTESQQVSNDPPSSSRTLQFMISVGVPESQFHTQWIRQYQDHHPGCEFVIAPTPPQLEQAKLQLTNNLRAAITPFLASNLATAEKAIQVWSYPDNDATIRLSYANPQTENAAQNVSLAQWWQVHWTRLKQGRPDSALIPLAALAILVVIGIVTVTKFRRSRRTTATKISSSTDPVSGQSIVALNKQDHQLRDDLAELVESNPELAAQIVHSWMNDAA